jgi:two-component system NtrC family response regulator
VLQDQTYEVLGDSRTRTADVRVVCATNADLKTMVEEHTFREDLFYRINLINLHLMPLRERQEDIPLLVDHFIRQTCAANGLPVATASQDAIQFLQTLPFPGNIRELKNLVERTLLLNPDAQLSAADFAASVGVASQPCSVSGVGLSTVVPSGSTLEEIERASIAASIEKHSGNLSLVAKELGISRGALYRKIEKHGL